MINGTLFKKEIKANYKILVIFLAVLTLYGVMIVTMFDPRLGDSLAIMMESMPDVFAAFGMSNPGTTLLEFLINYLYGFLLVVFPMIFLLLLSNRLIARYIDRGSMAYLLASPNKRSRIAFTQAAVLLLSLLLLISYVSVICILASEFMFPGELEIPEFLLINAGLLGLHVFLAGICFCASCIFHDTRRSYGVGAGLCIAFFLIQMLSQTGDKFEALKYATPLTLFQPDRIAAYDGNSILYFLVLYAAGLLFIGLGIGSFCKRDLSI